MQDFFSFLSASFYFFLSFRYHMLFSKKSSSLLDFLRKKAENKAKHVKVPSAFGKFVKASRATARKGVYYGF